MTSQIVTKTSIPININRDSVFNYIREKRTASYLRKSIYRKTRAGGSNSQLHLLPSKGNRKILTVLVQFPDVHFQNTTGIKTIISNMMNQENYRHIGQSRITGSVYDYFRQASYNQLKLQSTVIGPYTVSKLSSYYGQDSDSDSDIDFDMFADELASETMNIIKNKIDISQFDNDGDGWVECVHILYAGQGQKMDTIYSNAIWPHQSCIDDPITFGGKKMSNYIMTSELDENNYAGIGTICHELGHMLGAPDFYDVKNGDFSGTGAWDLMADGMINSYTRAILGLTPAHPNPYLKTEIFDWAPVKELSGTNVLDTLRPSELDSNSIYKLSTSTPTSGEYYLLENRQQQNLPGTGLVIYHVSSEIEDYIEIDSVNVAHRQNMYVVDANNHIEKSAMGTPESYGNINSAYATFRDTLSENMYFTSTSLPSNCNWNGDTTYNKDVCFISEEMIDGEMCVKFVLNPEISGPDILCDSAIYSLKHVPSNANIQWSYIRPSETPISTTPLLIGFGQGTKNVCFKRGNNISGVAINPPPGEPILPIVPLSNSSTIVRTPYSGTITIKADISLNNDTFTLTKNIYMPDIIKSFNEKGYIIGLNGVEQFSPEIQCSLFIIFGILI
mgnify:CR=1 FL=1